MISLCVTNFNREHLLFEAIEQVLDDDRVSEIIISDDCSEYALYLRVVDHYKPYPKVKVSRNDTNMDCFRNKRKAVSLASNEWVIVWDSDNVMTKSYIDAIWYAIGNNNGVPVWFSSTILQPVFARPHFDFRMYGGTLIGKHNVRTYLAADKFTTALNAMNYFVNRDEYLRVWDGSVDPVTSDSIWQNYCWLRADNSIQFLDGLEYDHRVHEGSHYKNNNNRTAKGFHESIIKKLKALR